MAAEYPLVSIVIPAYNQAEYLKEAIDSVLAQDYPEVELIVLDDGSSDSTPDIIASYGEKFVTGSHSNCGQAATLNKGWRRASGSILGYLSADDFLLPGAVRQSVASLADNPQAVACYCDFDLIDPASKLVRHVRAPDYSYADMILRMICAPGPGAFFRRSAYERTGGWDESLRQVPDFEFWLRLGALGPFVRVGERLAAYRIHDFSQSFAPCSEAGAEEPSNIIANYLQECSAKPDCHFDPSEAMANAHLLSARLHLRSGRFAAALTHIRTGLALCPRLGTRGRSWRLLANGLFNRMGHKAVRRLNRWRNSA